MDYQRVRALLEKIQTCINDCNKELVESEDHYQEIFKLITNSELRSVVEEHHLIYIELKGELLNNMKILYSKTQDELLGFDKLN